MVSQFTLCGHLRMASYLTNVPVSVGKDDIDSRYPFIHKFTNNFSDMDEI